MEFQRRPSDHSNSTSMGELEVSEFDQQKVSGHKTTEQTRLYNQSKKSAERVRLAQNKAINHKALARKSHRLPTDVARTLVSAASRLISTLFRACDTMSKASVDMSIRVVCKRASIMSSHPNICEICG
jgi:hypothetical protein